jgi:hypothetical protein
MSALAYVFLVVVLIGLGLVGYGAMMLRTGRTSRATEAAFPTVRQAALYTLTTGAGVALLGAAMLIQRLVDGWASAISIVVLVVAMVFFWLGFFRFRPRA